MSKNTVTFNNGRQMQVNTNLAKLFPFGSEDRQSYSYTNSTYDPINLPAGTVMGVVTATGKSKPLTSAATDGSQYPVGILAEDYTIEEGDTVSLSICVKGQVRQDMILLQGGDSLSTQILGKRIFERIGSDTVGILIDQCVDATAFDNTII